MSEAQCGLDVFGLGAFFTTRQEDDQLPPTLLEIHPITGAVVNPQFRHAFADRFNVAWIVGGEALDSGLDTRSCLNVAQDVKPLGKYIGLAGFNHGTNVAVRPHNVNGATTRFKVPNFCLYGFQINPHLGCASR